VTSTTRPSQWLRFRVVDNGIGVHPEALAKIFQPFIQAEQSTVREYGGTGLGLTVRAAACCCACASAPGRRTLRARLPSVSALCRSLT
jgi:signal transduction histidine kinase